MSVEPPKVSVLLAYYNGAKYVEESIRSVFDQTYPNWELIVVDDCSPDPEATSIIESLSARYGFKLIRHEANMGATRAFQTAFEHSSGEYISIISHDDLYTPNKIRYSMELLLEQNLDAIFCNGTCLQANGKKRPFACDEVMHRLAQGQDKVAELIASNDSIACLLTQGAVYKRKIWTELAWMKCHFLLDDWPFTIEVWRKYKTSFDPEPVYIYRMHENNTHRNYWKWFPARVQVVADMIDDEHKLDVLSFLLTNIGAHAHNDGKTEDAFRLAVAGLMLSECRTNTAEAEKLIARTQPDDNLLAEFNERAASIRRRTTKGFAIYRGFMRKIIELIPVKKTRKAIKARLKI